MSIFENSLILWYLEPDPLPINDQLQEGASSIHVYVWLSPFAAHFQYKIKRFWKGGLLQFLFFNVKRNVKSLFIP